MTRLQLALIKTQFVCWISECRLEFLYYLIQKESRTDRNFPCNGTFFWTPRILGYKDYSSVLNGRIKLIASLHLAVGDDGYREGENRGI